MSFLLNGNSNSFSRSSVMLIDSLGIAVKHIGKLLTDNLGNFNRIFLREH